MKTIITIILFITVNKSIGQIVEGYSFKDYMSTKSLAIKKAKINYNSNPTAKQFKTLITQDYNGKIDFASFYNIILWGCGTGCISGVMIDVRDGKVYNLPSLGWDNCGIDGKYDEDDRTIYKGNSRLFVTGLCESNYDSSTYEKTFFIYEWNELKKKFIKIKETKSSIKF